MKSKQPSINQFGLTSSSVIKSRRRFVQGLAGGGLLGAGLASSHYVYGSPQMSVARRPEVLSGKTFNLSIDEVMVTLPAVRGEQLLSTGRFRRRRCAGKKGKKLRLM